MKLETENLEVLLVEDDVECADLVSTAVKMGKVPFHINAVVDGVEAMDFLHKRNEFKEAPRPDLIFLDLHLPRKSGREVYSEVKNDPGLKVITMVLLTTTARKELQREFGLAKNFCRTKPALFNEYISIMQEVDDDFRQGRLAT
jgi:CheY-like chemotaxis protein